MLFGRHLRVTAQFGENGTIGLALNRQPALRGFDIMLDGIERGLRTQPLGEYFTLPVQLRPQPRCGFGRLAWR